MQPEFIFPRSAEVLPPAAACAPRAAYEETSRQVRELNSLQRAGLLKDRLQTQYALQEVSLFRSGKDALYQLFQGLSRVSEKRLVAVAAYTCPDVAAAVIRAGFTVVPVEVSAEGPGIDHRRLLELFDHGGLAAVVLSNLYGLPEQIPAALRRSAASELLLVDDACQAAFSSRDLVPVGAAAHSIGVLSFGRGKALGGVGGGALLLADPGDARSLAARVWQQVRVPAAPTQRLLQDQLSSNLQWSFSSPGLYRVPASIPWLGLGETHCSLDFETGAISDGQVLHALTQIRRYELLQHTLSTRRHQWQEALSNFPLVQHALNYSTSETTCTRYPISFERIEDRNTFLRQCAEQGLGASGSYPAPLQAFSALHPKLQQQPTPQAERLARTLVTLPVHSYVQAAHIEKTVRILKRLFS